MSDDLRLEPGRSGSGGDPAAADRSRPLIICKRNADGGITIIHRHPLPRRRMARRAQEAQKVPARCPMCLSDESHISEIERENQWWWHCAACDFEWDPVRKV